MSKFSMDYYDPNHPGWTGPRRPTQRERLDLAIKALKLHVAYEAVPRDRGGSQGPKGRAWTAFIEARDAAIAGEKA